VNLEDHLAHVELIDCAGRTTHRLTLLIDGRVRVRVGEATAVVDPGSRSIEPPSRRLGLGEYGHDQVLDIACNLARGG
jgi:hypothetical protein